MPRTRRPTLAAAFAIALVAASAVHGAITLDANFDAGSLKNYSVVGNQVNLIGRDSYAFGNHPLGDGHWRWLYFKASGVAGANLMFSITGEFGGDSTDYPPTPQNHELADHEMAYSYDGVEWAFFPRANNTLQHIGDANVANDRYTFALGQPFAHDQVYVAYALPYPYARSASHAQAVLQSPWAAATASGNSSGVIGQSPAGADELGRSIPALNLFAYRITNPATDAPTPKRRAFLAAGQHAAETLGLYTYEGLVDWLISDDPRAAALRDRAEFFCYPTLNASGRFAGLSRSMLQWQNSDSNGYWHPQAVGGNDYVSPERKEQRINGEAMRADEASTPGDGVDLFLDFHSSVPDYQIAGPQGLGSRGRDDWGYIANNDAARNNPWWLALRELQPNLLEEPSGTTAASKTLTGFALGQLGAEMSVTLENQFAISRPVSYYHDLGKNIGLAMYEAWVRVEAPGAGDFDEDGDVDGGDLAAWRLGNGIAADAARYQGDANGDGRVDGADYLAWQRHYTGPAPAEAARAAAPEPAASVLAGALAAALLACRRGAARAT